MAKQITINSKWINDDLYIGKIKIAGYDKNSESYIAISHTPGIRKINKSKTEQDAREFCRKLAIEFVEKLEAI